MDALLRSPGVAGFRYWVGPNLNTDTSTRPPLGTAQPKCPVKVFSRGGRPGRRQQGTRWGTVR